MDAIAVRLNWNYIQADRVMLPMLGGLFLMSLALSNWHDTWQWAFWVGLSAGLVPAMMIFVAPDSRLTRSIVATALMVFSALHIHQTAGATELYFGIFVLLAFLLIYRDWQVIVIIAAVIAVHHFNFYYLQELGYGAMFFTRQGIDAVLIHFTYVVVESGVLAYVAILLYRGALQSAELDARVAVLSGAGAIYSTVEHLSEENHAAFESNIRDIGSMEVLVMGLQTAVNRFKVL